MTFALRYGVGWLIVSSMEETQNKINQFDASNLKTGYWEETLSNGGLNRKGYYENGLRIGYWEVYYSTGDLMSKGNYEKGKKIGYREERFRSKDLMYLRFYGRNCE